MVKKILGDTSNENPKVAGTAPATTNISKAAGSSVGAAGLREEHIRTNRRGYGGNANNQVEAVQKTSTPTGHSSNEESKESCDKRVASTRPTTSGSSTSQVSSSVLKTHAKVKVSTPSTNAGSKPAKPRGPMMKRTGGGLPSIRTSVGTFPSKLLSATSDTASSRSASSPAPLCRSPASTTTGDASLAALTSHASTVSKRSLTCVVPDSGPVPTVSGTISKRPRLDTLPTLNPIVDNVTHKGDHDNQIPAKKTDELGNVEVTHPEITHSPGGRPYSQINGAHAMGALLPSKYQPLTHDPRPFICPIRTCRQQHVSVQALGIHFKVSHRDVCLNDNLDSTFSVVGVRPPEFVGESISVVSQLKAPYTESEPKTPSVVTHVTRTKNDEEAVQQKPYSSPAANSAAVDASCSSNSARPLTKVEPNPWPPPLWRHPSDNLVQSISPVLPVTPGNQASVLSKDNRTYVREATRQLARNNGCVIPQAYFEDLQLNTILNQRRKRDLNLGLLFESHTPILTKDCFYGMIMYMYGDACRKPCSNCKDSDNCFHVGSTACPAQWVSILGSKCHNCSMTLSKWPCSLSTREDTMRTCEERQIAEPNVGQAGSHAPLVSGAGSPQNDLNADSSLFCCHSASPMKTNNEMVSPLGHSLHTPSYNHESALKMEDWERMPGRIEVPCKGDEGHRNTESNGEEFVLFSNMYLSNNRPVQVGVGIGHELKILRPGHVMELKPESNKLCLCVVSGDAKITVKSKNMEIDTKIGPGGLIRVTAGQCVHLENEFHAIMQLHITTIDQA